MYLKVILLVLILLIISVIIKNLIEKIKINKIDHFKLQKKYISLSTIPPRIKNLEPVIRSLLNQSIKPDKIYINIPRSYKRFKEKIEIPEFIKKEKLVKIFYTEYDYGPATKFIGSLNNKKIKKNDLIVVTDDDIIKNKNWLENLIRDSKNNRITGFVEKNLGQGIIWGYLGYIFQKKLIDKNDLLKFYYSIEEKCNLVDDHWFTGYCNYRKIPIYNKPIKNKEVINKLTINDNYSLVGIKDINNNRKKVSENCREIIYKKYGIKFPFWCCIGCCYPEKPSKTILSISGK